MYVLLEILIKNWIICLIIFKCFALEHNVYEAKHLRSVLRPVFLEI
jgi:hypothetical protein